MELFFNIKTELFKIELFICIKMDLVFIAYDDRCAMKPNQTKLNHYTSQNAIYINM